MFKNENDKAIHFAKAHIRQLTMPLADRREKFDKQLEVVKIRRRSLAREEAKLQALEDDINGSEHDSAVLAELIEELEKPREAFTNLSDEQFAERQSVLRWEIADYTGTFTFVQGGF